jgi:hypothetical protein
MPSSVISMVHPIPRRIYVYLSMDQVVIRTEKDDLDGGALLPGFRLSVHTLFEAVKKPLSS